MNDANPSRTIALGLLGAAIGGCAGYFAFFWVLGWGFYALALPPTLLGWVAGSFARRRSTILAAVCGVAGFALGIFTEWKARPFSTDTSLSHFLTHLHQLTPVTLLMLALGTYLSYRLALGNEPKIS